MPRQTEKIDPAQRDKDFFAVFRRFDSKSDAIAWISEVTGARPATVWVWRCKGESGYKIPNKKFIRLMDAIKKNPPPQL